MDVVSRLEHQAGDIMKAMYDSINNDNFDSVSGDTDRVSGVVDKDYDANDYDKDEHVMPYDKDTEEAPYDSDNENILDDNDSAQMPAKYANDYETVSDIAKYDKNMKNDESNDVGKNDMVLYKRDNSILTKDKRPIETSDIDNNFMREYDEMYKLMEYKQTYDYYEARRHIQSTMHHRLDLGPNMLPGAQQHTTVESVAALSIQEKTKGKYDENIYSINGQYGKELYNRAESMVPQLDGTYNVSDDSNTDSHSYLDLASSNIIAHRM